MKARIVIALAFVTIGLLGLAACGGDDSGTTTSAGPPPPPPATPPPPPPPQPPPPPLSRSQAGGDDRADRRAQWKGARRNPARDRRAGEKVAIVVGSDVADHVHLHGYDKFADVAPGKPARLAFVASIPGRFEVELEDRGLQIADIEVRP